MTKALVFDFFGVLYNPDLGQYNQPLADYIRTLKPRYKIGLLSNMSRANLDRHLQNAGFTDVFDAVLASGETQFVKPQQELFAAAAAQLKVDFADILFIDDTPLYTLAAQSYGMQTITYKDFADFKAQLTHKGVV